MNKILIILVGFLLGGVAYATESVDKRMQDLSISYESSQQALDDADLALKEGNAEVALDLTRQILQQEPSNDMARVLQHQAKTYLANQEKFSTAKVLIEKGDQAGAWAVLRPVVLSSPDFPGLADLLNQLPIEVMGERNLRPNTDKITLEFRDTGLRAILEVLSRLSGIQLVIDKESQLDRKVTIFVKDANTLEVLDFLLSSNGLSKKILTTNSVLIFPASQAKQAQYDDLFLRSFYLTNADPKSVSTMLKSALNLLTVHTDDKLGLLIVKGTKEAIRQAEKLIRTVDLADPEVMLDVEVLEVRKSRLTELGILYPTALTVITPSSGVLTLDNMRDVDSTTLSLNIAPSIRLLKQDNDTSLLANPRIRAKNREKASIMIGDRLPIVTTTIASGSNFATQSATYLDVGLKLEVEPKIKQNNEVVITLSLEVSNATQSASAQFPTVGTRKAQTVMVAANGETQILAGLINDQERKLANKVPGLGDLPVIGRLFSDHTRNGEKSELVLLITPHVMRNIIPPGASDLEFYSGTQDRLKPTPYDLSPKVSVSARPATTSAAQQRPPATIAAELQPEQTMPEAVIVQPETITQPAAAP